MHCLILEQEGTKNFCILHIILLRLVIQTPTYAFYVASFYSFIVEIIFHIKNYVAKGLQLQL